MLFWCIQNKKRPKVPGPKVMVVETTPFQNESTVLDVTNKLFKMSYTALRSWKLRVSCFKNLRLDLDNFFRSTGLHDIQSTCSLYVWNVFYSKWCNFVWRKWNAVCCSTEVRIFKILSIKPKKNILQTEPWAHGSFSKASFWLYW